MIAPQDAIKAGSAMVSVMTNVIIHSVKWMQAIVSAPQDAIETGSVTVCVMKNVMLTLV